MSKIYELLGYPISDNSPKVVESRRKMLCPFISDVCDGGGNRDMAKIDLSKHPELKEKFPDFDSIHSGICSIQMSEGSSPWIICPRRLLYMGEKAKESTLRGETQKRLLEKCNYPKGTKIGIWTEVSINYSANNGKSVFDYKFDYVLMPLGRVTSEQAAQQTGIEWRVLKKRLEDNGYTLAQRDGKIYIDDFPVDSPTIVEVMTSSTSGGNKAKRSNIPQAFEDCMLGKDHLAPGINCRQVWARMASQLIVKSQAAMAWNGKTIWVLQDLLADYISSSTALDLHKFISEHTDEVNILAFSYGDNYKKPTESTTVSLDNSVLYSGSIRSDDNNEPKPCFQDIVLASVCPPRPTLIASMTKKRMANRMII